MSSHNHSQLLEALCQRAEAYYKQEGLPFVTITYAQSLDGSIAGLEGQPLAISCKESLIYTHALRASHDGILVGINTVISDDPALSTRYVDGENPRPIVLDSRLRIPLDAQVLSHDGPSRPIIFTTDQHDPDKKALLQEKKVCVIELPSDAKGWINLAHVLPCLGELGVQSLMVEGGGKVITSFIQSGCVNHLIVTLSMKMIGGTPVLNTLLTKNGSGKAEPLGIDLSSVHWEGSDMIIHGDPVWNE